MRPLPALLAAAALLFAAAPAALAHPHPKALVPAVGAVVASPPQVRMTFSEALIASFSGLQLKDAAGHVLTGPSALDPAHNSVMFAPVRGHLAPGIYTVEWHAVASDTHHVAGHYSFQVK